VLHLPGERAQPGDQQAALGQPSRRCQAVLQQTLTVSGHQHVGAKQRVIALDFTSQGVPHKAGEQRGAATRDGPIGGLLDQEFQVIRRAQQVELRCAPEILPQDRSQLRAVEPDKLFDLRIGQRLDAHLQHG